MIYQKTESNHSLVKNALVRSKRVKMVIGGNVIPVIGDLMGNWLCGKHNTYMIERSILCPYCEIDRLRNCENDRLLEKLVQVKHNNDLATLRKELKNSNRGAEKNHDIARLAVQEAITFRKALELVCRGISLMSSPGSLRISWEAIMEEALQNVKEAE